MVVNFSLIDTTTGDPIAGFDPLPDGAVLNKNVLPPFSIRANTAAPVGSVVFQVNDETRFKVENVLPYLIAGDWQGRVYPWLTALGVHEITATAYSGRDGSGDVVSSASVTVTISDLPVIRGFALINCDTGLAFAGYGALTDDTTIPMDQLPSQRISLRALTTPDDVGSVVFGVGDDERFQVENVNPYAILGNDDNVYEPWEPGLGSKKVTATPYTGFNASGAAGVPMTIMLNFMDSRGASLPSVERFSLVNADDNQPVKGFETLEDGAALKLAELPERLNVVAYTEPDPTGSVVFSEDNQESTNVENQSPYTLRPTGQFWLPSAGFHQIQATPFTESNGGGERGTPAMITVSVDDKPVTFEARAVVSFTLVDGETCEPIPGFDPLLSGAVINLAALDTRRLNIRANTDPEIVGSVVFGLNNTPRHRVANSKPYLAFDGDWSPGLREYRLTAAPFTQRDGEGGGGQAMVITFNVIDQS